MTARGERGDGSSSAVTGVAVSTGDRGDWSSRAVTGVGAFSDEENDGEGIVSADSPVPDLYVRGDAEFIDSNLSMWEGRPSEFSLRPSTNSVNGGHERAN